MALFRCGYPTNLGNLVLKSDTASNTISDCIVGKEYLIAKAGNSGQTLIVTGGTYNQLTTMTVSTSVVYYGVVTAEASTITLSGVGSATSSLIVFELD